MPVQIFSKVVEWYSDITIISIGLILCMILTVILFRSMCTTEAKSENFFKMFHIQIYIVFITVILYLFVNLLRVISLPLSPKIAETQQLICNVETTFFLLLFGLNNLSIDILLISRLKTVFQNTHFALSKCVYYSYTIGLSIYWCFWMLITGIMVTQNHSAPYNVYTESIDYNGNATTCVATAQHSNAVKLILPLAMIGIIFGNLIVWILFIRKLYILLKLTQEVATKSVAGDTKMSQSKAVDGNQRERKDSKTVRSVKVEPFQTEFIDLMRDQTMLVSLMVFVTFFTFSISIIISFGQLLFTINYINTLCTIFLSFKFTRYYFNALRCNRFSRFCCKYFERMVTKKVGLTVDEVQLVNIPKMQTLRSKSSEKTITNQSGTEATDRSSEVNVAALGDNISEMEYSQY